LASRTPARDGSHRGCGAVGRDAAADAAGHAQGMRATEPLRIDPFPCRCGIATFAVRYPITGPNRSPCAGSPPFPSSSPRSTTTVRRRNNVNRQHDMGVDAIEYAMGGARIIPPRRLDDRDEHGARVSGAAGSNRMGSGDVLGIGSTPNNRQALLRPPPAAPAPDIEQQRMRHEEDRDRSQSRHSARCPANGCPLRGSGRLQDDRGASSVSASPSSLVLAQTVGKGAKVPPGASESPLQHTVLKSGVPERHSGNRCRVRTPTSLLGSRRAEPGRRPIDSARRTWGRQG
jgi:hypothetical protein